MNIESLRTEIKVWTEMNSILEALGENELPGLFELLAELITCGSRTEGNEDYLVVSGGSHPRLLEASLWTGAPQNQQWHSNSFSCCHTSSASSSAVPSILLLHSQFLTSSHTVEFSEGYMTLWYLNRLRAEADRSI